MKKFILLLLILIVLSTSLLFVLTRRKPTPHGADLVPATSLLFVRVPDLAQSRADLAGSPMGRLWNEPEMRAFLERPLALVQENLGMKTESATDKWLGSWITKFVLDAQAGEMFAAVTHVRLFPPQVGVLIGTDVKRQRVELAAKLSDVKGRIQREYPEVRMTSKEHLGVKYDLWKIRPGMDICQTFLGNMLVFSMSETAMQDAIARAMGKAEKERPSLSASASFQKISAAMPEGHEVAGYLNFAPVQELMAPLLFMSGQGGQMAQGLAKLDAMGLSSTIEGAQVTDKMLVTYRTTPSKMPSQVHWTTRALTSPQTLLYAVGTGDWRTRYREMKDAVAQPGNDQAMAAIVAMERQLAEAGIDIESGIAGYLGPENALIGEWREGTALMDVAMVLELRSSAEVRPHLATAVKVLREAVGDKKLLGSVTWEDSTYKGAALVTLVKEDMAIRPVLAVTDKFVILAMSADFARALIDRALDGPSTLAANPGYTQTMARLGEGGHAYVYCDLPQLVERGHPLLQEALRALGPNEFIESDKLPSASILARHLTPLGMVSVASGDQSTTTMISPMGGAVVIGATVLGGGVYAVRTMGESVENAFTGSWPKPFSGKDVRPEPPARPEVESGTAPTR